MVEASPLMLRRNSPRATSTPLTRTSTSWSGRKRTASSPGGISTSAAAQNPSTREPSHPWRSTQTPLGDACLTAPGNHSHAKTPSNPETSCRCAPEKRWSSANPRSPSLLWFPHSGAEGLLGAPLAQLCPRPRSAIMRSKITSGVKALVAPIPTARSCGIVRCPRRTPPPPTNLLPPLREVAAAESNGPRFPPTPRPSRPEALKPAQEPPSRPRRPRALPKASKPPMQERGPILVARAHEEIMAAIRATRR
mmetsp:Transcript_65387/g.181877  ORF Transcript_65387/g.181877 Transcript_65387/m.181877 type:complete len:251 (-) Transcript_65387:36-788(-)